MATFLVALIICTALIIDGARAYHKRHDMSGLKQITFAGILFMFEVLAFIFERSI